MKNKMLLNIVWLYPDLMSTYGDRGNIMILEKRISWRNISHEIIKVTLGTSNEELEKADIIFMGGAQDRQQEIVSTDLAKRKKTIQKIVDSGVPGLFICGAYQFLGNYYVDSRGQKIPGLEIFDLYTTNPGLDSKRLIGNLEAKISTPPLKDKIITGFENHGGRTYLSNNVKPFSKILSGYGNNGEDRTEGAVYKNAIGTYLHGPFLANNPSVADYLISCAIETKYNKKITLDLLDDNLETLATDNLLGKKS